jgi:hypothetical protein
MAPYKMLYCYGMMVLKLMNLSKWSLKFTAYARKDSFLNEPGWKKLKTIARRLVHDNQGLYHLHYNVMLNKQTKAIWHPSPS